MMFKEDHNVEIIDVSNEAKVEIGCLNQNARCLYFNYDAEVFKVQ